MQECSSTAPCRVCGNKGRDTHKRAACNDKRGNSSTAHTSVPSFFRQQSVLQASLAKLLLYMPWLLVSDSLSCNIFKV